MLEIENLSVNYGTIRAVNGVSFSVGKGELVALLGANGAGKSSTLMAIAGAIRASGGSVRLEGRDILGSRPERIVRKGLSTVPETRNVFPDLTVIENLKLGGYIRRNDTKGIQSTLDHLYELFPRLAERTNQPAGTLSGGEQQMLVIARALMSKPRILLLDEPSLGLAPTVIETIFDMIATLKKEGLTILVVEQNVTKALSLADRAFVLRLGSVAASGTPDELKTAGNLGALYLGGSQ